MTARGHRPKGRRTRTRKGRTDPSGAAVPQPGIRRRTAAEAAADREDGEAAKAEETHPADVVHVIPAEALESVDTEGMTLPIGAAKAAKEVDLPGDTVLVRPSADDVPTEDDLDERDAAKTRRRKRTGPRPPADSSRRRRGAGKPSESTPPPTDPTGPTDPD